MFCGPCFDEYCTTKFRATIGKSRKIPSGSKVLIACSGGTSSLSMVHMIKQGLNTENQHRRLRFIPSIVHINESAIFPFQCDDFNELESSSQNVIDHLKTYQFDLHVSRIEKVFDDDETNLVANDASLLQAVKSEVEQLNQLLSLQGDESNKEEIIRRLRIKLITSIAVQLGCDIIFFGSSATKLATQLIVDVAQGKGNQIHLETGFSDERLVKPIMKPMRELTKKELTYYNLHHKIKPITAKDIHTKSHSKISIGKATEAFMVSLERDFPATVFSVCRISTKVKGKRTQGSKCSLCGTICDNEDFDENSAMAARVSSWSGQNFKVDSSENSLVLCYTCSGLIKDKDKCQGKELLKVICKKRMKAKINDCLLDNGDREAT